MSCGRTSLAGCCRRRRRPFFSPPLEANDAGLRVTEDTLYYWRGPEAGEAVGVPQALVCVHPAIMPDSQALSHAQFPPLSPRRCCCLRCVYPLTKEKSLLKRKVMES